MSPTTPKLPRVLHHEPEPGRPGCFQVVDTSGAVWATGVPTESAARVFAGSPGLLLGYDWMLEEVVEYFHVRWDIGYHGPDFKAFVDDEGELEDKYPGAPEHAEWLQNLRERSAAVRHRGESPVEPYIDPQVELF
jgi:hypothetical protein